MTDSADAAAPAFKKLQEAIDKLNESSARTASSTGTLEDYANFAAVLGLARIGAEGLAGALNGLNYGSTQLGLTVRAAAIGVYDLTASFIKNAESQAYVAHYLPIVHLENDGLTASIGRAALAFDTYWRGVEMYKSGLIAMSGAAIAATGNMRNFESASHAQGFDSATEALRHYSEQLTVIPGITNQAATSIASAFGAIPDITGPLMQTLVNITSQMSATGDQAVTLSNQLAAAFTDPATSGSAYLSAQQDVSAELRDQFETAKRSNDVAAMRKVLVEEVAAKERLSMEEMNRRLAEQITAAQKIPIIGRFMAGSYASQVVEAKKATAEMEKQIKLLIDSVTGVNAVGKSENEAAIAAQKIVEAFNPLSDQLTKINSQMKELVASGAAFRLGDGSGGGGEGGPNAGIGGWWTPDKIKHAMDRLISEGGLSPEGAAGLVGRWSGIEAQGGPTSVGSNGAYGIAQLLGDRKKSFMAQYGSNPTDFDSQISHAIQELGGTESAAGYVLRNATTPEAGARGASMFERAEGYNNNHNTPGYGTDNFTGRTPAARVLGIYRGAEAQGQAADQAQSTRDKIAGGNPVALEQVEAAKRAAADNANAVVDAERMVEAWKKVVATTNDAVQKNSAIRSLNEAQKTLDDAKLNVARSRVALEAADNETAKQKLATAQKQYELDMKAAGTDTAKQNEAKARLKAAETEMDNFVTASKKEAENSRYAIAQQGLEARKVTLREEVMDHTLSAQDKLKADMALEAEQEKLDNDHYAKLRSLETEGTLEYQTAQDKMTQIAAAAATRRAKIAADDAKGIQHQYDQVTNSVASSVNSSIMAMIQGSQTLGQSLKSVGMSIVGIFVKAGVDMVAKWAEHQAMMLTNTVNGQAAQTAAAGAGVAAQKAINATSISGDAGRAAAGAFAAVAGIPIIGPVLAPAAAAAAFAGVEAFGSFDTGSWSIPHDQLAMVHAGEMIVPSRGGIADEFRSSLGGGGRPGGGDTHVHLSVQTMDSQSFASYTKNNSKHLIAAVRHGISQGHGL
jgi:hypothetical protein